MPSEIVTKLDMNWMVQANYKVMNEKMGDLLTLWESLDRSAADVEVGQRCAVAEAFGHCGASE